MRRTEPKTPAIVVAAEGSPVYRARSGVRYRGVRARDVGNGLIYAPQSASGVTLEDSTIDGAYRVIENKAAKGESADLDDLVVRRVTATNVRRGFARIRHDSGNGLFEDVTASGAVSTGARDLPVGIAFDDTAHDFRLDRCVMRGFRWKRGERKYWNGDGYSSERGNRRLLFRRCAAYDNSDGGFDLKSEETRLDDCVAGRNARNYRLWSSIKATRLTSLDPVKIGGIGDTVHIALLGAKEKAGARREPITLEIEHLVARSERGWPIFTVYHGPVRIIVGSHDIDVPRGTPLLRLMDGGSVPGGITFRGTEPKL